MPRLFLAHITTGSGCGSPFCGAKHGVWIDLEKYLEGYNPISPLREWCMACEEEVYKNSPHPELIELARTPLE